MINLEREEAKRKRSINHKGKKVQQIERENIELVVRFFQGFAIDERDDTKGHDGHENYRVVTWTDKEDQYKTQRVKCYKGVPCFNEELVIPLNSQSEQYLYIELLREGSRKDPGTSNGTTVMGRAKIRLPSLTSRRMCKCKADLVGLNSDRCVVSKGYLDFSMKLHRYYY
ncbi:unnamed protein product [Cochlearia groenlandica]